jgi:phospho-N-acetylmuramoyl-pentapeptide-transferase
MLYNLFQYLDQHFDLAGAGLFQYSTFRASLAFMLSLIISVIIGKRIILWLQKMQIGESIRDLGLEGQLEKKNTPTMGGLILIAAILLPVLLFARLDNIYVQLCLLAVVSMGAVGFLDDYLKKFKRNKDGLKGRFKIVAQVIFGGIVGAVLYFNHDVRVKDFDRVYYYPVEQGEVNWEKPVKSKPFVKGSGQVVERVVGDYYVSHDIRSLKTNVPFFRNNELDYSTMLKPLVKDYRKWSWLIFIPFVIFIITAVSNAANLTDGIDGLAAGTSAITLSTLAVFAFVSGNIFLADYLNILYIPMSGEMVVVCAAVTGACMGFLWYNAFPAQVFMGDTGSLMLGGVIATIAIILRKELLIPILCGIFLAENLSVVLQVAYFKYTKRKYGEGRRIFLMSPLHHHYQKKGYHETKIVTRFWIVGILLAVLAVVTLKIR